MGELTAKAPAQAPWQRDLAVSYSKAGLDRLAQAASDGCPLSALIEASATVTVNATLEGGSDGN